MGGRYSTFLRVKRHKTVMKCIHRILNGLLTNTKEVCCNCREVLSGYITSNRDEWFKPDPLMQPSTCITPLPSKPSAFTNQKDIDIISSCPEELLTQPVLLKGPKESLKAVTSWTEATNVTTVLLQHLLSYIPSRMRKETKRATWPLLQGMMARATQTPMWARSARGHGSARSILCAMTIPWWLFLVSLDRSQEGHQTRAQLSNDMHPRCEHKWHGIAAPFLNTMSAIHWSSPGPSADDVQ